MVDERGPHGVDDAHGARGAQALERAGEAALDIGVGIRLVRQEVAHREDHERLRPGGVARFVVAPVPLDGLDYVGAEAQDEVDSEVCEQLRVVALGLVGREVVLAAPAHGDDDHVCQLFCTSDLGGHHVVASLGHAPGGVCRHNVAVEVVGVGEEREGDALPLARADAVAVLLARERARHEHLGELGPRGARVVDALEAHVEAVVGCRGAQVPAKAHHLLGNAARRVEHGIARKAQVVAAQDGLDVDEVEVVGGHDVGHALVHGSEVIPTVACLAGVVVGGLHHGHVHEVVAHGREGHAAVLLFAQLRGGFCLMHLGKRRKTVVAGV